MTWTLTQSYAVRYRVISKLDGRLEGHARDPISAGLSMDALSWPQLLQPDRRAGIVPGAGGSAAAALLHLLNKPEPADRPEKVILRNRLPRTVGSHPCHGR